MRQHIAIAIAALMITSMAFAISTTSVSATHATPTISISPDFVKGGESYVFTLSVTNEGGDPIDTVEIWNLGGSFTSINSMLELPKDNQVESENVTLADGTPVTVVSASVTVPENTDLLVLEGENILFGPGMMVLLEDALVEVPDDTGTILAAGAEVTVEEEEVAIDTGLRLLADTPIDNENRFPEDTLVELVADNDVAVTEDLTLAADNEVNLTENDVRLVNNVTANYLSLEFTILAGTTINLAGENTVVLLAGTVVEVVSASVTVAENTDVTISGGTVVTPSDPPVPMPEDWMPSVDMWSSTEDNIAEGETVEFPFSAITPDISTVESYDIIVRTVDTDDDQAFVIVTLTVDGEAPSIVDITISPDPAKLTTVTITVEASEELSELGEVTVTQAGVTEEENIFTIEMASTDGITWTGTYAVIENWDGTAGVAIENSTDLVGNEGGADTATFEVDTIAPDAPTIPENVNVLPPFTDQPNQLVYGTATDAAKVLIRVNDDELPPVEPVQNSYSVQVTLVEGPNEVGVSFADEAGNASEENVQDVFVDSVAPTVDMVSIAGIAYTADMPINDNTPTIVLEALDPGYPDTGSGILLDNLTVMLNSTPLENATPWENSGLFENTYSAGLIDNTYTIEVTATDGFGHTTAENFTFVVDTEAPDLPDVPLSELPIELVDERDHVIRGYAEDDSTIKVYADDTVIKTGKADSSGYYRFTIRLPEGTNDIYVSATDAAGNESDRRLYGTVTVTITPVLPVDTVVPVVSITAPESGITTDEASIVIVGRVSELAEWTVSAPSGIQSGMTDSAGNFSASIALVEGTNTIIVTAVDAAGNPSAPVSIEVTRTVVPLETYAIVLVILLVVLVAIAVLKR